MKKTTSLCFSQTGLLNPESLDYAEAKQIDTIGLFCDGSEAAYQHMCNFIAVQSAKFPTWNFGLGRTPLYDLRVVGVDGTISKPHYVHSEDMKFKWVCAKIATPSLNISISDITKETATWVDLDANQTELITYLACRLWLMMLEAETRLCFPATVIDRLTRYTWSLTPETINIKTLREESGLESLDYNVQTDLLSVVVANDIFSVKLSVLNSFYKEFILPLFNSIYGRRLRIQVSVAGATGQFCEPVDMSYGDLGRLVEDMKSYAKEQRITADNSMDADDLLAYAKKVKVNEESCLWATEEQTLGDILIESHDVFVHPNASNNVTSESESSNMSDTMAASA